MLHVVSWSVFVGSVGVHLALCLQPAFVVPSKCLKDNNI